MSTSDAPNWLKHGATTVIVAVVVGAGSSYLTAQQTIAVMQEKGKQRDERIQEIKDKIEENQRVKREMIERTTRLETKMDILLDRIDKE